jgi:iron complex transport system permease protein
VLAGQTVPSKDKLPDYSKYIGRKVLFILACAIAVVVIALIAICSGSTSLSLSEMIEQVVNQTGVVWCIRLPRVLTAVVAGAMLAVAGTVMQCILRNPLSEPYTLGISQAASFGAAFAIVILAGGSSQQMTGNLPLLATYNAYTVAITAFCFSLVSTAIVILLTRLTKIAQESIVLAGVIMGSLFSAGLSAVQYFASEWQLSSIMFWMFGDLSRVVWNNLAFITAVSVPVLLYFLYNRWTYNAIDAGIDTANSLGVNVDQHITVSLILSSLVTSVIVSMMGIIAFIGLLSPHIVRQILGSDHRFLLPASALVGSLILLVSDTVGRTIISPVIIPVGIITSFLGGPLFLIILIRGYRK